MNTHPPIHKCIQIKQETWVRSKDSIKDEFLVLILCYSFSKMLPLLETGSRVHGNSVLLFQLQLSLQLTKQLSQIKEKVLEKYSQILKTTLKKVGLFIDYLNLKVSLSYVFHISNLSDLYFAFIFKH